MPRLIATLLGGILIGVATTYFFVGGANGNADIDLIRDIVAVEKMSETAAEKHREERFERLTSVEAVYTVPGVLARAEALHALAGRSDAADVQRHIFDANRIADQAERAAALAILFARLTELDPQSALALARTDYFKGVKGHEQVVWSTWARSDLDEAIFAAKTQTNVRDENMAVQSLYAAFGYMGNETTDRIEAELGIEPDRLSRGRYLYRLADRSPAEAIAYINRIERRSEQQEQASLLAHYLSLTDPIGAKGYSELFANASNRQSFEYVIKINIAKANPEETLQRLLASGVRNNMSGEFHSAVRALVDTDLDAAMRYYDEIASLQDRQIFASLIASRLAHDDPIAALAWAREQSSGSQFPQPAMTVLMQIATTDPDLAMSEALSISNVGQRANVLSNILEQIVHNDPQSAIKYLEQIPTEHRRNVKRHFMQSWMRQDSKAAFEWALTQDNDISAELIQGAGSMIVHTDLDAALRLLPRLADGQQASWRQQIAQQLATQRSTGEAQAFINQFQGQPGYDQLQSAVIAGVAQQDAFMAKQMADQLASSEARDKAYMQIISQQAQKDPVQAAQWLRSIANERMRDQAKGLLARLWYRQNPDAATQWVTSMLPGSGRDDAILRMSSQWHSPTESQLRLIESMENRDKRGQAKLRQIYVVMRSDPARARKLLEDSDISDAQRQQFEDSQVSRGFGARRWRR